MHCSSPNLSCSSPNFSLFFAKTWTISLNNQYPYLKTIVVHNFIVDYVAEITV